MAADAQAQLAVDLEAAGRGQEPERWRPQRVCGREHDASVVDPVRVRRAGWALECEVPFEEIAVERAGMQGGVRGARELRGFFEDALDGGRFRVEFGGRGGGHFLGRGVGGLRG